VVRRQVFDACCMLRLDRQKAVARLAEVTQRLLA
jgi:hypothetical protein